MPSFTIEGADRHSGADIRMTIEASRADAARHAVGSMGILISSLVENPSDPLEALATANRNVDARPPPLPRSPTTPPPTVAHASRRSRKNIVAMYVAFRGIRSVVFQCLLVGWTAFIFFVFLAVVVSHAEGFSQKTVEAREELSKTIAMGMCCLFGGWCLVSVPLGFAVIATLRSK